MKRLIKPTKPTEPIEFFEEPVFEFLDDGVYSLHDLAAGKDPKTVHLHIVIDDYPSSSYGSDTQIKLCVGINKRKNIYYEKQLESYKKKLTIYEKKMKEYEEQLPKYKEWLKSEEKRKKEKAIKELESKLNKLRKTNVS